MGKGDRILAKLIDMQIKVAADWDFLDFSESEKFIKNALHPIFQSDSDFFIPNLSLFRFF